MIINWRKSSHSATSGGDCVEVGCAPREIGIRDSKNPRGGRLSVSPETWAGFVAGIGRFQR